MLKFARIIPLARKGFKIATKEEIKRKCENVNDKINVTRKKNTYMKIKENNKVVKKQNK